MHARHGSTRVLALAVLALAATLLQAGTASAALPPTFSLDPRRTYLRTNSDTPVDALKVDLGTLGIARGSTIRLERLGAWDLAAR